MYDSSCNGDIKMAHILRNNCEYLRNNGEYLIHKCNNLYNNIRRADKLTSMTSLVAGCISIEPTCVYNHLDYFLAVFFDLSKAFDMTCRYLMPQKPHLSGFHVHLPTFIQNSLFQQNFCTRINNIVSN